MKSVLIMAGLLVVAGVSPFALRSVCESSALGAESSRAAEAASIRGAGFVEPISEIRQLSFETPGVLAECRVDTGSTVEKGEILATLRDEQLLAEAKVAAAELAVAQAEFERRVQGEHIERISAQSATVRRLEAKHRQDQSEFDRLKKLFGDNNAAAQEYEDARWRLAQSEAAAAEAEANLRYLSTSVTPADLGESSTRVELARAKLNLAETRLERLQLRAPFRGTVLSVYRREGEPAGLLEPVLAFANVSTLHVRAEIDERFAPLVKIGQLVEVRMPFGDGTTARGHVVQVEPLMGRKQVFTRSAKERADLDVVEIKVALDEPLASAIVNMRVDVEIQAPWRVKW